MYFSAEDLHSPKVSSIVMNYKMRSNKNQPARGSVVWPDLYSVIDNYLWWQKNGKTWSGNARLRARVAMEEGLLSV